MSSPEVEAIARLAGLGVTLDQVKQLSAPTPRNEIKTRPAPHSKNCDRSVEHVHTPLSYVDARYVMDRLDTVVSPENWQRDHRMTESGKVACGIGINVDGNWIWKWDGAGETDIEGEKGSFSDSFKRAAVSWGIARDLYDKGAPAEGRGNASSPVTAGPAPTAAARPTTRPAAAAPSDDSNAFWDRQIEQDDRDREYVGNVCPVHNIPWVLKPAGTNKQGVDYRAFWTCGFRPPKGTPFCSEKPSKAWQARQETAA